MGRSLNILIFFLIFISNIAKAETYKIECIYEKGIKNVTIDEKTKKVIELNGSWNYRKAGEFIYVFELADLDRATINRFTIDLENLQEEQVIVKVPKKPHIEEILMLEPKFKRGEITYEPIDLSKKKSFEKWYVDPKSTKNKVVKNWRSDWKHGHPEEYLMYENNSDIVYQLSLIHECNFIN